MGQVRVLTLRRSCGHQMYVCLCTHVYRAARQYRGADAILNFPDDDTGGRAPAAHALAPPASRPRQPDSALTVADLVPSLQWLFRAPATGELMGPFLISVLRRSVKVGDITARDARLLRVWRQGEPEVASMSLQQALELPMLRARSRQLELLRARHTTS